MEPRAVAHFDVLGRIGGGGMGVVYRARDRILGREVALKLVRPEQAGDALARQRFLREARAAGILSHPGIATVYEAGEALLERGAGEPQLFIAQELVAGEPLSERVRRGPLPVTEVLRLGVQLAEALGEAHEHGIVHRDVKPSNLMLTPEGRLKVLDFGLARRRAWAAELPASELEAETWSRTAPGLIVGTPAYMAPEQIAGDTLEATADVYAAGCVLYELLAGRPPHVGASTAEVLRRSLTETPRPVAELRPEVPPGLAAVVARALAREPGERFPNGRALAEALREAETRPVPVVRSRARWRPVLRRAGAAVLLLAAVGVVAWLVFARGARPALAFRERDFVLVADVANGTGEPVFDLALKSAIETDLRQSRYVNVYDTTQVQNTLRLMRLEPDTRLDEKVGRDVCLRAGVRALVVPRILRAGEAYRVGATLVEPTTGRVVAEASAVAQGREQVLLTAIDTLTRDVRGRLGESLDSIARTDPPFAQYTTSSLEALDLLDRGRRAWGLGDHATAERSLRQALEHDPRFAMARGSLGLVMIQFTGQPEEGKKMLAQALADAGEVSQREHLHLRALNRQFVAGDLEGALDDYRFISELYPDEVAPYNNSGRIYAELGRLEEAAAMYDRAHEADPRSLVPLWNLRFLCTQRLKDPVRAERASRALVALLPDNAHAAHSLAFSLVGQRRFAEAEEAMRATLKLDPVHPYALPNLAHLLLRRGAAEEAVTIYQEVVRLEKERRIKTGLAHVKLCLGLALAAAGGADRSRRTILEAAEQLRAGGGKRPLAPQDEALLAAMLAAAGRRDEARSLADRVARRAGRDVGVHYELARAYVALGDRAKATSHLEEACAAGYADPYFALIDPALGELRADPVLERLAPRGPQA
jgi:tetratricopeptide (TPR) repeat protein/tRNA A-37 threonylcarbamoyl transferase component Bud32